MTISGISSSHAPASLSWFICRPARVSWLALWRAYIRHLATYPMLKVLSGSTRPSSGESGSTSNFSCSSGLLMIRSQLVLQLELITISGINLRYFSRASDSSVHTNKKWYRFSGATLHNGQGALDPLYLFVSSCSVYRPTRMGGMNQG